jgi:N-acetylglucosamine-6-sulfatase
VRTRLGVFVAAALAALALPAVATARPNVVLIQTDDQNLSELHAQQRLPGGGIEAAMPNTLGLIARAGVSFNRYYVSDPLCCPSRATLLTGQYAHNDGVLGNGPGPFGGYAALSRTNNLAVWLQAAGYRTIHIGKYLNFYGQPPVSDPAEVPPGWSDWESLVGEDSTHYYYGYRLNDNGDVQGPFGDITYAEKDPPDYQTDVLTQRAVDQIRASAGRPFYLELDYTAPHGDLRPPWGPEPAPRHYDSWSTVPLPRPPGFNERDVSDKPRFIRSLPRLGAAKIADAQQEWQKEVESLRAVDDGVAQIVAALAADGQLGNTYVIFTTDNGFFQGEHRIRRSKFLPYEPSARVPMLIRGPGIPPGAKSGELVANVDIAPTVLGLAGAAATVPEDGRSLLPFAHDPARRTRRPILLEGFTRSVDPSTSRLRAGASSLEAPIRDFAGIRVGPYKYVRYAGGPRELYDLNSDPFELHSRAHDPRYRAVRSFLAARLRRLRRCVGPTCSRPLRAKIPRPLPRR